MDNPSPDMYDAVGDDDDQDDQWEGDVKPSQNSPTSTPSGSAQAKSSSGPLQKRRRVTRACDECRRKKIKCDGKQPCTHCTVYSYDCTYDQPSNRRRNPAPHYIEGLEHRTHRAETLLRMLMPEIDLNDPAIDVAVAQGYIPGLNKPKTPGPEESKYPASTPSGAIDNGKDTNLESMVRAVGQLDLDEQGNWDYHGHSSGLSFVRRMREQLGSIMGPDTQATPFVKSRPMSQVLDSPKSNYMESPMESISAGADLPAKELGRQLCSMSLSDAAVLLRPLHHPSFWRSFDRIYATHPDNYNDQDHRFLPLLYSVLALGCLFGKDEKSELNKLGYENAIDQGFKYFKAARQLMDITDCRDLTSIQAVIFMILFLQSSAKLSQCYAYVGVALRSALRMGLHRSIPVGFNPLEAEVRKRVFWVIRKMDIYVGAMLGLPQTLSDEDIDQEYPLEIDDEYITENGILPMPEGTVSIMTAFNAHTRLIALFQKIVRSVYPIKPHQNQFNNNDKSYTVPFSVIRSIENDLEKWKSQLPSTLSPGGAPPRLERAQQLLRLAYAFAQVLLYRPFLHFVANEKRSKQIDQRAYTCAASYVNVARNIIHLCSQMKRDGLLNGAFWFIMYTTFFSILSLVYFAAENPENATTEAIMKDALEGKEVLASLAKRSMAADRCTATLDIVFKSLPDWLREGRQNPVATKKRRHGANAPAGPQAARSHPDISATARESPPHIGLQRRASTFPKSNAPLPKVSTAHIISQTDTPLQSTSSGASTAGPFTPASSNFGQAPFLPNQMDSSNLMTTPMTPYGLPSNLNDQNPNLPDLSAMMFPSAEPFTYPNQPLTTFENNQFGKDPSLFGNMNTMGGMEHLNAPTKVGPYTQSIDNDNLEAQFQTLPSYMTQHQWDVASPQGQMRRQLPNANGMHPDSFDHRNLDTGILHNDPSWMGQQGVPQNQAFQGINLNDIFGGDEWNSMLMDQGFRQQ